MSTVIFKGQPILVKNWKSPYLLFNSVYPRDVIGGLACCRGPLAVCEALIGRLYVLVPWQGLRFRVSSTNKSKRSWVCFRKTHVFLGGKSPCPSKFWKESMFCLPLNELGHGWSWRIFFFFFASLWWNLRAVFCSRCDTCWHCLPERPWQRDLMKHSPRELRSRWAFADCCWRRTALRTVYAGPWFNSSPLRTAIILKELGIWKS